jgi:SAM-dependent methyltransferase
MKDVERLYENWNDLGRNDPLWAVLFDPTKKDGAWDEDEFYATGKAQIEELFNDLGSLGATVRMESALDFGCGVGRLTQALASYFNAVCGVDIAPSMIDRAREHNGFGDRCEYRLNVSSRLDGIDDSLFDFVHTDRVLQHIEAALAKGYIRELYRVLNPGGVLVFVEASAWSRSWRGVIVSLVPASAMNALRRLRYRRRGVMELHVLPVADVEALITDLGGHMLDRRVSPGPKGQPFVSHRYIVRKSAGPAPV